LRHRHLEAREADRAPFDAQRHRLGRERLEERDARLLRDVARRRVDRERLRHRGAAHDQARPGRLTDDAVLEEASLPRLGQRDGQVEARRRALLPAAEEGRDVGRDDLARPAVERHRGFGRQRLRPRIPSHGRLRPGLPGRHHGGRVARGDRDLEERHLEARLVDGGVARKAGSRGEGDEPDPLAAGVALNDDRARSVAARRIELDHRRVGDRLERAAAGGRRRVAGTLGPEGGRHRQERQGGQPEGP